jgi:cytochrome c-type biogenesis protein CcmH/NrfG
MSSSSFKSLAQKAFIIASGFAFLGMMVLPMMSVFQEPTSAPSQTSSGQKVNPEELKKVAQGYEKVLQREPNNPTALQGLVEVRLQLQDLPGSIAPLEKLVELYPQETQLKKLLTAIKQQVAQGNSPTSPQK